ncbi:MAG: hypothetical protein ACQER7_03595 [Bacteroidota bacterium]
MGKATLWAGTLTAIARDEMAIEGYMAPDDRVLQAFRRDLNYNNF